MANILLDKEILLESGTNELELLVFDVADYTFGINVAKVREVLPTAEITALPRAHSSIRRRVQCSATNVIPCVSLQDHLGITATSDHSESNMILTDFNQQQTAFLVDGVERIHRLSWENILAVPGLDSLSHTPVTALARCDNRLIVMLDFRDDSRRRHRSVFPHRRGRQSAGPSPRPTQNHVGRGFAHRARGHRQHAAQQRLHPALLFRQRCRGLGLDAAHAQGQQPPRGRLRPDHLPTWKCRKSTDSI